VAEIAGSHARLPAIALITKLDKEDREEDNRFGKSHRDNRLDKHFGGCFWITTY
jgi:hypothetical protein